MTPDTTALRAWCDAGDPTALAPQVAILTADLRALCDAADEVERERRRTLLALGRAVDAEAARAALVADLRALCDIPLAEVGRVSVKDIRALLDRHAPEGGGCECGLTDCVRKCHEPNQYSPTDRHAPEEAT